MEKPLFIRFWHDCYQRHHQSGDRFINPQFRNPICSPNFITAAEARSAQETYWNLISEESAPKAFPGYVKSNTFYLGDIDVRSNNLSACLLPLADALKSPHYLELLASGFPEDFEFLKIFLNYLAKENLPFFTLVYPDLKEPLFAATLGLGDESALCLNAVVKKSERGKGLSKLLVHQVHAAAAKLGKKKIIFWTKHDFLWKYSTNKKYYHIFEKLV